MTSSGWEVGLAVRWIYTPGAAVPVASAQQTSQLLENQRKSDIPSQITHPLGSHVSSHQKQGQLAAFSPPLSSCHA